MVSQVVVVVLLGCCYSICNICIVSIKNGCGIRRIKRYRFVVVTVTSSHHPVIDSFPITVHHFLCKIFFFFLGRRRDHFQGLQNRAIMITIAIISPSHFITIIIFFLLYSFARLLFTLVSRLDTSFELLGLSA